MSIKYKWKSNFFNQGYKLYKDSKSIAFLHNPFFSFNSEIEIKEEKFLIKYSSLIKGKLSIIDPSDNTEIGEIDLKWSLLKAKIRIKDRFFNWKAATLISLSWLCNEENGNSIAFYGNRIKGTINLEKDDELLALLGLYVRNLYRRYNAIGFGVLYILLMLSLKL